LNVEIIINDTIPHFIQCLSTRHSIVVIVRFSLLNFIWIDV